MSRCRTSISDGVERVMAKLRFSAYYKSVAASALHDLRVAGHRI
jgi:hypothetical protein